MIKLGGMHRLRGSVFKTITFIMSWNQKIGYINIVLKVFLDVYDQGILFYFFKKKNVNYSQQKAEKRVI